MTLVKICGITSVDAATAALRHGADYLGYVFFPPSPRDLSFDRARAINQSLGSGTATRSRGRIVGVFVDPDDALVDEAVVAGELDTIQLHKTSPERAAHLRRLSGCETWAAVAVKTSADLLVARTYVGAADRILYDAKTPPGAALPGGMGLRFDWSLLDGVRHPLLWALSGGLDAGNVAEAIRTTGAPLVDVSSGVESAPGVKDVDKIAAFLHSARA